MVTGAGISSGKAVRLYKVVLQLKSVFFLRLKIQINDKNKRNLDIVSEFEAINLHLMFKLMTV